MKGLRIIPAFAALLFLSYLGVLFVRLNPQEVVVRFGNSTTPSTALGFVILTSVLVGMIFSGLLCSAEMLMLYVQNQRMKRRLNAQTKTAQKGPSLLDDDYEDEFDDEELEAFERESAGEGEPERRSEPSAGSEGRGEKAQEETPGTPSPARTVP